MVESLRQVFEFAFIKEALAASAVIGTICSYLGIHVVLRRIVFVGAALAELSALGVSIGVLYDWNEFYCSLAVTLAGVIVFSLKGGRGFIPHEGYIGVGYVVAWAASIILLSIAPRGEKQMHDLLQGDILGVAADPESFMILAAILGLMMIVLIAFHRELMMVTFDPEMAQTLGLRTRAWNFLFFALLGGAIALAMKTAGLLLVFSLLVLPPITGLLLCRRQAGAFTISFLSSLVASFCGVWWSLTKETIPMGPAIVVCSFGLFVLAWLVSHLLLKR